MDIRFSTNPADFKHYTTKQLRDEFLIDNLFVADTLRAVYSHLDRMVVMGCMPVAIDVPINQNIDPKFDFGSDFVLERREAGVFNIGGSGVIEVDGVTYPLGYKDCLYIARGAKEVLFRSDNTDIPAKFYIVSTPAHAAYTTRLLKQAEISQRIDGSDETNDKRRVNQFITPSVLDSCQLCMGMTEIQPGSLWCAKPPHTHLRRMETYMYFELPENDAVIHLMGDPQETRHIIMNKEEAVLNPSWSMHSGVGTSAFTLIWAMAGENMEFDDMNFVAPKDLR